MVVLMRMSVDYGEGCKLTGWARGASEEDAHHVMNHITVLAKRRALRAGCVSAHMPSLPGSKHSALMFSPAKTIASSAAS